MEKESDGVCEKPQAPLIINASDSVPNRNVISNRVRHSADAMTTDQTVDSGDAKASGDKTDREQNENINLNITYEFINVQIRLFVFEYGGGGFLHS